MNNNSEQFGVIVDPLEIEQLMNMQDLESIDKLFLLAINYFSQINRYYENSNSVVISSQEWSNILNISEGWAQKVEEKLIVRKYLNVVKVDNVDICNVVEPSKLLGKIINLSPIKINFSVLKDILSAELKYFEKILWLYIYGRAYESRFMDPMANPTYVTKTEVLSEIFNCSKTYMSKSISRMASSGYLNTKYCIEKTGFSVLDRTIELTVRIPGDNIRNAI